MNARAKLHKSWHRELLAEWQTKGIYACERCYGTFGCALAHSKKRRLIDTKELYFTVAYLCQQCHHFIEYGDKDNPGTHERMEQMILDIIAQRSVQY